MPSSIKKYVDVILPLALPKLFTYSIPAELNEKIKLGMRVVVPFGKKKLYSAIAFNIHTNAPQGYVTKDILQNIDDEPIVLDTQLKFWEWISSYYMCSLGEVMKAALPSGLKMESDSYITKTENINIELTEQEVIVMHLLESKKRMSIKKITSETGIANPLSIIKSLLAKNSITISEEIESDYQPKTETYLKLTKEYRNSHNLNKLLDDLNKAPAQQRVIIAMLSMSENPAKSFNVEVSKSEVLGKVDVSAGVITALAHKGILEQFQKNVSRLEQSDNGNADNSAELNSSQVRAYNDIKKSFETKNVVLLHGVTSSGKTEIYIHLIAEAVEQGKQVLYLLPEIALTAQIIHRLRKVFGDKVGIYHSKYGDARRVEVYNGVLQQEPDDTHPAYSIILGVRSSIFLPFQNLGLIIVDEEHESTFKQMNPAPRYNARDAAVVLAQIHKAKVLLGTATPAIETYHNAQTGKFGLVELSERYREMELPKVNVVNLKEARQRKQMHSHFSAQLLSEIDETLKRNEQVILFQNRRGFSPYIECEECGWIPQCEHCDVTLTYHKHTNSLVCHYCGFTMNLPSQCMACGSHKLEPKGFGTEKVEDELKIFFPDAVIERIDLDTTRSRNSYERIISDFEEGKTNILIGTQMVTKGLDFDKVSLVGILNADNMLNFPDFRAFERSFQLMSQVSGRAGRKGRQGLVIIQTTQPTHPVIQQVVNHDYNDLYTQQMGERQAYLYPPFCRLLQISLKHKDKALLNDTANSFANALKHNLGEYVLGPETPTVSRVQGLYIMNILIKIPQKLQLNRVKELINYHIQNVKQQRNLYALVINVDVDPQ
ncbi:MAG TPA: primosomal protein N' [Tenuifilaceae bacterium]|nr:primosomal protein N' [Tenuifilaceae bacterium]